MRIAALPLLFLALVTSPLDAQLALRTPRDSVRWESLSPGLELTQFVVEAGRPGFDVRIIAARIDPKQFLFSVVKVEMAGEDNKKWTMAMTGFGTGAKSELGVK